MLEQCILVRLLLRLPVYPSARKALGLFLLFVRGFLGDVRLGLLIEILDLKRILTTRNGFGKLLFGQSLLFRRIFDLFLQKLCLESVLLIRGKLGGKREQLCLLLCLESLGALGGNSRLFEHFLLGICSLGLFPCFQIRRVRGHDLGLLCALALQKLQLVFSGGNASLFSRLELAVGILDRGIQLAGLAQNDRRLLFTVLLLVIPCGQRSGEGEHGFARFLIGLGAALFNIALEPRAVCHGSCLGGKGLLAKRILVRRMQCLGLRLLLGKLIRLCLRLRREIGGNTCLCLGLGGTLFIAIHIAIEVLFKAACGLFFLAEGGGDALFQARLELFIIFLRDGNRQSQKLGLFSSAQCLRALGGLSGRQKRIQPLLCIGGKHLCLCGITARGGQTGGRCLCIGQQRKSCFRIAESSQSAVVTALCTQNGGVQLTLITAGKGHSLAVFILRACNRGKGEHGGLCLLALDRFFLFALVFGGKGIGGQSCALGSCACA